ncbi:MAG: hypothetical protein ACREIW_07955 [Chthoniobacterales bacterium]
MSLAPTPRNLISASFLLLALAAFFGVLNNFKIKGWHDASSTMAQQEAAEIRRSAPEKNLKGREASAAEASQKISEAESKAAKAEADLAQARKEKADLQAKMDTTEAEMASLGKNVEEFGAKPVFEMPGVPTGAEADAQMDELRRSLERAEREKEFLSGKLRTMQERVGQLEDERKRRLAASAKPGVRGTVLVVNHAYNFVVLDLGGRHGVEPNTEMLVVRDGVLIGKIRISSVELATSIGDIITSSLARGVQVQPGDIVIYGGSSS